MSSFVRTAALITIAASTAVGQTCDCTPAYAAGSSIAAGPIASYPIAAMHCVVVPTQWRPLTAMPRYEERTVERTVMTPKWVDEKRKVTEIEYKSVQRERDVTVYETRPRTRTVQERTEVLEPVTRTRKENYSVLKPVVEKVRREVIVSVPERIRRTAHRTEYRTAYEDVVEKYTTIEPQRIRRTATRPVIRTVPVTATRTVSQNASYWATERVPVQRPITAMVAATSLTTSAAICGCPPCVPVTCGYQTAFMTRQVYVPQVVTRQEPYTQYRQEVAHVPYEYDEIVYRPVERERTVRRERLRAVQVPFEYTEVVYRDKKDYITERVERLVEEPRERTIRYTELVPKTRVENVRVTEYEEVPVKRKETYTALVPKKVEREVTVQVLKETPRRITERVRVPVGGTVIR